MPDAERIAFLEEQVAYLTAEKQAALSALETARALGAFETSLNRLDDPAVILEECTRRMRGVIELDTVGFYLVDEESADFHLALCDPAGQSEDLNRETLVLIDDMTFAWALERNRPVLVHASDDRTMLLHAMQTASRVRGMLVAFLDGDRKNILDTTFQLISLLMLSTAQALESFELYRNIRQVNEKLHEHVRRLEASESELIGHRRDLKREIAAHTQDLSRSNEQLRSEIAQRAGMERELRQERDFITAILDTAAALVYVLDDRGRIVRFNKACEVTTEHAAGDVIGRTPWEVFQKPHERPDTTEALVSLRENAACGGAIEETWQTRTGQTRIISWTNSILRSPEGEIEHYIASGLDVTEQRRAELALRESEARFRTIFQEAGMGIVVCNIDGTVIDINPAFQSMTGYSLDELKGRQLKHLTHPDEVEETWRRFVGLVAGQSDSYTISKRYLTRSGEEMWVNVTVTAVTDQNGKPLYTISMVEDITERKFAQDAVAQSNDFMQALIDALPSPLFFTDPHGRLQLINSAFRERFAQGKRGLLGEHLSAAAPAELAQASHDLAAELLTLGDRAAGRAQCRIDAHGGERDLILDEASLFDGNDVVGMVGVLSDVTELKELERALRLAEETYRTIFENAIEGIFQISPRGEFLNVNPAMARIMGYSSPVELIAGVAEAWEIFVDPDDFQTLLDTLIGEGSATGMDMRVMRKDGQTIWLSLSATAIRDDGGTILRFEGLAEDVTERKQAELALTRKATHDDLTDIPNRYLFRKSLAQLVDMAERTGAELALFYLDLNDFKTINDTHGHQTGDALLKEVATRLKGRLRRSDIVARLGGDEFALILEGVGDRDKLAAIAKNLIDAIAQPFELNGVTARIGVSIGVASYPRNASTPQELVRRADMAMYRAKNAPDSAYLFTEDAEDTTSAS
jgi:diguanylate cyclase (GGDEF)-like protein/PAS domain S-box-containing protein